MTHTITGRPDLTAGLKHRLQRLGAAVTSHYPSH